MITRARLFKSFLFLFLVSIQQIFCATALPLVIKMVAYTVEERREFNGRVIFSLQERDINLSGLSTRDIHLFILFIKNNRHLIQNLPRGIRQLDASDSGITDDQIIELGKLFPVIYIVGLQNCKNITEASIDFGLWHHYRELQILNLIGCPKLRDVNFELYHYLKNIKHVHLK